VYKINSFEKEARTFGVFGFPISIFESATKLEEGALGTKSFVTLRGYLIAYFLEWF